MEAEFPQFRLYTTIWSKKRLFNISESGIPREFILHRRFGSVGIIKERCTIHGVVFWLVLHGDGHIAAYLGEELEYSPTRSWLSRNFSWMAFGFLALFGIFLLFID